MEPVWRRLLGRGRDALCLRGSRRHPARAWRVAARGADGGFTLDSVEGATGVRAGRGRGRDLLGRRQAERGGGREADGAAVPSSSSAAGSFWMAELEWLTDGIEPSMERGSIFDQIGALARSALLLDTFEGRLEYHTPWSSGRDVSHLFRGEVDLAEAASVLARGGFQWLRLVDNGVLATHGVAVDGTAFGLEAERVHAYHLIPEPRPRPAPSPGTCRTAATEPADCRGGRGFARGHGRRRRRRLLLARRQRRRARSDIGPRGRGQASGAGRLRARTAPASMKRSSLRLAEG